MPTARSARKRQMFGLSTALVAGATWGCGGATPLLHPAHTLKPGSVTFGAGVSGTFVAGDARSSLNDARALTSSGGAISAEERVLLTQGTVTSVLATPGLAPWLGARAGVAERTEAGVGYTGRWARVDARHAFEDKKLALSLGLGLSALLPRPTADGNETSGASGTVAGIDSSGAAGFGIDAPILVGYRSEAELVQAWGGVRGSFEQAFGNVVLSTPWPAPSDSASGAAPPYEARFDGHRLSGGALVGLAVGVPPVWVAVELSARYLLLEGNVRRAEVRAHAEFDGWSLEPAGGLYARF